METSYPGSFGEMLQMHRKRQRLTQQQLARKLGIHQNTLGAWERGDYLPATRGTIIELSRCLRLNEEDVSRLLDAGLLTVTPRWSLPYQRNPFFTGRQAILQQLHILLAEKPNVASTRSCVLHGLGGIGKTQTAIEYAYRHAQDYAAVFWMNTETEEALIKSFITTARTLKLPINDLQKRDEIVLVVLEWLNTHRDWLLIFDNVTEKALIQRFVPASRHGSLLFTTRLPTLGTLALHLELEPLSLEESTQFLLSRTGKQLFQQPTVAITAKEIIAMYEIARVMGGLPLALDQAAAYVDESQCGFVLFLALFQRDALQVLQVHPASITYPHCVENIFTGAFARLQQEDRVAAEVLLMCCFLAPENIPETFFSKGASYLNPELRATLTDPFQFNATLKNLLTYALLRRNTLAETLSIHPLVQLILKEQMSEKVQRMWIEQLIHLLDQLLPDERDLFDIHWQIWCEQILPHAQYVLQEAEYFQLVSYERDSLLNKVAMYLSYRAGHDNKQAEALCCCTVSVREQKQLRVDHPNLALTLAGLASTPQQGKYHNEESETDLFDAFLRERCVLSVQASSRAADLWQAYREWTQTRKNIKPLSRQMFAFQLQSKGCYPARTNAYRIWYGIELKGH